MLMKFKRESSKTMSSMDLAEEFLQMVNIILVGLKTVIHAVMESSYSLTVAIRKGQCIMGNMSI